MAYGFVQQSLVTYKELQAQIAELERKAQEIRANELEKAVQQIKTLMQEYGITIDGMWLLENTYAESPA